MKINYNSEIKKLRDIIWGVVTNPVSQIEQLTLLLFLKILSEQHNDLVRISSSKLIFEGEYEQYHFDNLKRLSGYDLVERTKDAIESLNHNPHIEEPIKKVYERAYLQVNDPRVLSLLINEIGAINIKEIDLGDFYEHILSVLGTQKEAGQFRTPRHIIKFMVDIVEPKIGETILDPACGTAGFLTQAYTYIRDNNTSDEAKDQGIYLDKLTNEQRQSLLSESIFGYDIDPNMIKFAITNLYLHNISHPNISEHNTLTSEAGWDKKFDIILANPPFASPKGGIRPIDKFSVKSNRTEVLFVDYIMDHLTYNGKAGVIVPEGIIFQSGNAYKQLRRKMVEENYLWAVVSLPSGVFQPYSGVKTSILLFDRELAKKSENILFAKVENDGFNLGAQRKPIDKNDLPNIEKILKRFKHNLAKRVEFQLNEKESRYIHLVFKSNISESEDYNLNGERYKVSHLRNTSNSKLVPLIELVSFQDGLWKGKKGELTKSIILRNTNFNKEGGLSFENLEIYDVEVRQLEKRRLQYGDIILEKSGGSDKQPVGRVVFFDKSEGVYSFSNFTSRIRVIDTQPILPKFLYYILNHFYVEGKTKSMQKQTSGIRNLELSQYKLLLIPLPPLSVQQEIVEELDRYQRIIDGAKQVVENYKPQIELNTAWKSVKLRDLFESLETGVSVNSENRKKYSHEKGVLKTSSVTYGTFDPSQHKAILETEIRRAKVNPRRDSIIISRMNTPELVGASAYVSEDFYDLFLPDRLWQTVRKSNDFSMKFVSYIISSPQIRKLIRDLAGGTSGSMKNISKNSFLDIEIPLPDIEEQLHLVSQIESQQSIVEANKQLIEIYEQKIINKVNRFYQ